MQTYSTYLERVFALPFEDASRIFATIKKQIENDEDMTIYTTIFCHARSSTRP